VSTAGPDPRAVLSRLWFDKYPEPKQEFQFFIWLAGGIGAHRTGGSWRYAYDWFDFERQGDRLAMKWLQDGKKVETKFSITKCDEAPPFDLCLDLDHPPRGPKRLYGFSYDDDESSAIPWAKATRRSVEEQAKAR
jgi:hypothetical protein